MAALSGDLLKIPPGTPSRMSTPRPRPLPLTNASQSASYREQSSDPPAPTTKDNAADRTTQALIRKTLCPQLTGSKGRDALRPIHDLPPLTSRNDVEIELYALIAIVVREFVQSWYSKITPDEAFVAEVVHIIAHCTRGLEQRLRKVDLENLVLNEIPEVLDRHIKIYLSSHETKSGSHIEINAHEAYHALWPLPWLSPVPQPGVPATMTEQEANEAAYRQLVAQAVLAILLPTEDLENPCLTALVSQCLSELVIGNILGKKVSQPWFLYEIICTAAKVVDEKRSEKAGGNIPASQLEGESKSVPEVRPHFAQKILPYVAQLAVLLLTTIRLIVSFFAMASSLPPRSTYTTAIGGLQRDTKPSPDVAVKPPFLESKAWSCFANLIDIQSRMPWLSGFLSFLQFEAVYGPGHVAAFDSTFDRLCSYHVQSLLSPSHLAPTLRSLRAALFPHNAPGTSSLQSPASAAELHALRRRAAQALWRLLPEGLVRVYLGGPVLGRLDQTEKEGLVDELEGMLKVLDDEYCNKHLMYSLLDLLLVRLMPEIRTKGVAELWEERLG